MTSGYDPPRPETGHNNPDDLEALFDMPPSTERPAIPEAESCQHLLNLVERLEVFAELGMSEAERSHSLRYDSPLSPEGIRIRIEQPLRELADWELEYVACLLEIGKEVDDEYLGSTTIALVDDDGSDMAGVVDLKDGETPYAYEFSALLSDGPDIVCTNESQDYYHLGKVRENLVLISNSENNDEGPNGDAARAAIDHANKHMAQMQPQLVEHHETDELDLRNDLGFHYREDIPVHGPNHFNANDIVRSLIFIDRVLGRSYMINASLDGSIELRVYGTDTDGTMVILDGTSDNFNPDQLAQLYTLINPILTEIENER